MCCLEPLLFRELNGLNIFLVDNNRCVHQFIHQSVWLLHDYPCVHLLPVKYFIALVVHAMAVLFVLNNAYYQICVAHRYRTFACVMLGVIRWVNRTSENLRFPKHSCRMKTSSRRVRLVSQQFKDILDSFVTGLSFLDLISNTL